MEHQTSAAGKPIRGGTKSCLECRRRKVRCIRASEHAPICRRCEERGLTCLAQTHARPRALEAQKVPSRHRISQLEHKVARLSKVIGDIQSKLGLPLSETPETIGSSPDIDSGDDSSVVHIPAAEQPSHLRSLLHNDWLRVDTRGQTEHLHARSAKATTHLLEVAGQVLQKLRPPKDEFLKLAKSSSFSKWLVLLHELLPQPFTITSQQEFLESYDAMNKPDVGAMSLATWLITVAITTQQEQRSSGFSRTVSDAVERTILSHDGLTGTVQGLGIAIHFVRLQLSLGSFQKAWIRMRHFIAIAELMGLPNAFQAVELSRINGTDCDETQTQRAQLWESICSADRLFGMTINLPSATRRYQLSTPSVLTVDGIVQTRAYVARLTDITTKVQDLDDMNRTQRPGTEMMAVAYEIDRELKELVAQTPRSWWAEEGESIEAGHVLRFLHSCVTMRAHLPLAMRQDSNGEYTQSRNACVDACESVANRYHFLRRHFPSGIFLARIMDLQAFTAVVVLLLATYNPPLMERSDLRTTQSRIENLVARVTDLMEDDASTSAQTSVTAIRSLHFLLQQDGSGTDLQELSIKVPLLGNVRVRRNVQTSHPSTVGALNPVQPLHEDSSWGPSEQTACPPFGRSSDTTTNPLTDLTAQPEGEWQWDPLSWSVDNFNVDHLFQDTFMGDGEDQFDIWQGI